MRKISIFLMLLMLAVPMVQAADNCYLVVAGREATVDGSVLLGHNEDNGIDKVFRFRHVERAVHAPGEFVTLDAGGRLEQADTTWAYTVWEMPGMNYSHGMVNEHAVAVVSNACPSREDQPELVDGGIGPRLRWLVVERARTAREGARLVGELVERFGYSASGRTLTIADPREAWQVAMVNGKHWVARRVPDDQVAVLANSYGIHEVDLADTLNYMGSRDLIDYAVSRGWYDPTAGAAFDFEKAYAELSRLTDPNQRLRQWTGFRRFANGDFPVPGDSESLPFAVIPPRPVTRQMVYAALRDHYENSPFTAGSCPLHSTCEDNPRAVCHGSTNHGDMLQLKADVPATLRAVWWYAFWRPCNSLFLPLFPAAGAIPDALSFEVHDHVFNDPSSAEMPGRDKAIGLFHELTLKLDGDEQRDVDEVRGRWEKFEQEQEAELETLLQSSGSSLELLAEFSRTKLGQAMEIAGQMLGNR